MRPHSGFVTAFPAALALVLAPPASAQRSAEPKIDSLLARMSLEEKLGQLNQLSVDGQPSAEQLAMVRKGLVGSLFNLTGAAATHATQLVAVTDSRLHIPLIFGHDVIHGYRTIFPIPLGEAASWDRRRCRPPRTWPPPRPRRPVCIGPSPPWWTSRAIRAGAGSPRARARIPTWDPPWPRRACAAFRAPTRAP